MRWILALSIIIVGITDSLSAGDANSQGLECVFQFSAEPVCSYRSGKHDVVVKLQTKKLAEDELVLVRAHVVYNGRSHVLPLSPEVSMVAGNVGVVSFADINFDNVPDLAVSTSFGIANQYFDYWTYDPIGNSYITTGNYPKLAPRRADKTLSATVKLDAANHEQQTYSWMTGRLIRKR